VIFSALLYAFVARYKLKGFLFGAVILCVASFFLYGFSINFKNRIDLGILELLNWSSTSPSDTSIGLRLEFIYQSLKIIGEHLFFGVGVGNFGSAYSASTLGLGMAQSVNPHNQYVLFLVETGLIGFSAFLYLNFICWKCAGQLSLFWMHATRIVILSYGVTNLFNSFLFDFSERLFFSGFMALAFSELLQKKKELNSPT
jgi:O-antigen ligase